jgi:dTDP-4-dehydrorhamnose reductase
MSQRIVVLGAAGRLGHAIVQAFSGDAEVVAMTRPDLDITDDASVETRLAAERPTVIINCASDNDVDGAESHPLRALEVNAFAVRTLARVAGDLGATLIHYSTDFVFDGTTTRPYVEEDQPNPQGVYAASKLLGEWFAGESPRGFVLRVESLFGAVAAGRSSLDSIVARMTQGAEVPVFTDRTVSPSYVHDIAWATRELVRRGAPVGLYHCVNTGATSWLEIATEVARLLRREARLKPITLNDVTLRAARPTFCALSNTRLTALGIIMPTWQDALARHLQPA